jgi:hypothetical protein
MPTFYRLSLCHKRRSNKGLEQKEVEMKMNIAWHKECLRNLGIYILNKQKEVQDIQAVIKRSEDEYNFRLAQIEEATKQHKFEYDADKFMVKRKSK